MATKICLSWTQHVRCLPTGPGVTFGAHVTEARLTSGLCSRIQESFIRSCKPARVTKTADSSSRPGQVAPGSL